MRLINANNLKLRFNPKELYTGAAIKHLIDNQNTVYDVDDVIDSLEKMQGAYRKLFKQSSDNYHVGFVSGLEYALVKLRGEE